MTKKSRGRENSATTPSNQRLAIRVALVDAEPPIWRRLELAPQLRLDQVHDVLQAAFEWEDSHLHEFELRETIDDATAQHRSTGVSPAMTERFNAFRSGGGAGRLASRKFVMELDNDWELDDSGEPETGVTLGQLLVKPGDVLFYLYDFGDGWEHSLTLEKTIEVGSGSPRARCVAGEGASPPEDSGGMWRYNWTISASQDPSDPSYEDAVEQLDWMSEGQDWDPLAFDLKAIDREVRAAV